MMETSGRDQRFGRQRQVSLDTGHRSMSHVRTPYAEQRTKKSLEVRPEDAGRGSTAAQVAEINTAFDGAVVGRVRAWF